MQRLEKRMSEPSSELIQELLPKKELLQKYLLPVPTEADNQGRGIGV